MPCAEGGTECRVRGVCAFSHYAESEFRRCNANAIQKLLLGRYAHPTVFFFNGQGRIRHCERQRSNPAFLYVNGEE